MDRKDQPNEDKNFRKTSLDFKQESYDITEQDSLKWFRIGGWNHNGLPVAELVAKSVFYGWCVEGVLAGQYGLQTGKPQVWGTSMETNFANLMHRFPTGNGMDLLVWAKNHPKENQTYGNCDRDLERRFFVDYNSRKDKAEERDLPEKQ